MSAIDTRGVSRNSFFLMADISVADKPFERIKVRNLSDCGMMGEGGIEISSGDRVVVELRNIGKVVGRVAWTQNTRFGLAFEKIIDPRLAREPVGAGQVAAPRYTRPAVDALREPVDPKKLRSI